MPGFPSIENAADRSLSSGLRAHVRALMPHLAVGILAGVAAAHVRLHLGIAGHKALFWMAPVLVARLRARHPLGATVGASTAMATSLALGGNLAGQSLLLALVLLSSPTSGHALARAAHLTGLKPWTCGNGRLP